MNTPEDLKQALQAMKCDEEELLLLLLRRSDERKEEAAGFSIGYLVDMVEDTVKNEALHTPVVIRIWDPERKDSMDVKPYAVGVESELDGAVYKLVLDVEGI